jgi:hypothetical protein
MIRPTPWLAVVLASGALATGCSSSATASKTPPVLAYSLEGHRFTAGFPSSPVLEPDPPAFGSANGLPAGTVAAGLAVGQLGSTSRPHSYEVVVADLPAASSPNLVAAWFKALAEGLKPARIDGHPGVRHISVVRQGSATYFGGFELLEYGRTFFVLGAYDPSLPAVTAFLGSVSIRS